MSIKITAIWNDLRPSVEDYTPLEMLGYYRVANWFVHAHGDLSARTNFEVAEQLCTTVDNVFEVMRCISDHRAIVISDILHREYCDEPASASDKIEMSNVSRTTYYAYLKQGEELFSDICSSIIAQQALFAQESIDGAGVES